MRLFIARSIGTNTYVTVDRDPYIDMYTGETVTTRTYFDHKRPDCVLVGECKMTLVNWRNAERWVVVTSDNVAPAGTYDVGDPSDPLFRASEPSNPEARALETELGLGRNALRGWTWGEVMDDALSHTDAWRALFTDGSDVWLRGGN